MSYSSSWVRWFDVDDESFYYTFNSGTQSLYFDLSNRSIPIGIYVSEIARIIATVQHNNWFPLYANNVEEIREMVDDTVDISTDVFPTLYRRENGTVVVIPDEEFDDWSDVFGESSTNSSDSNDTNN